MAILNQRNKRIICGAFGITVLATVGLMSAFFNNAKATYGSYISIGKTACTQGALTCSTDKFPGASIDVSDGGGVKLRNYTGEPIQIRQLGSADATTTIYLQGNNTIDMTGYNYGLDFPNYLVEHDTRTKGIVSITGDEGAVLNIVGRDLTADQIYGIFAVDNLIISDKVKINIDITSQSSDGENREMFGIRTLAKTTIQDNEVSIKLSSSEDNRADYYGIRSSSISVGENSIINFDIADNTSSNLFLKTSGIEMSAPSSTVVLDSTNATVKAREISNKVFSHWNITGTDLSDESSSTIAYAYQADTKVTTTPVYQDTYSITVNNGTAIKTSAPAGQEVAITANTPERGKKFKEWVSNDVTFTDSAAAETTFTMPDSNVEITATYEDILYSLSLENANTGSSNQLPAGSLVTITADAPTEGMEFDKWEVSGGELTIENNPSTTFTMPYEDISIKALYKKSTYQLGVIGGIAKVNGVETTTAQMGDEVILTPNETSNFIGWEVTPASITIDSDGKFTMPASDVSIQAKYDTNAYKITTQVDPSVAGSISGAGEFLRGATASVTAMANEGYHFIEWEENGTKISDEATLSFTVTGDRTLTAKFAKDDPLEFTIDGVGMILGDIATNRNTIKVSEIKSEKELVFHIDADYRHFTELKIDNVAVTSDKYEVLSGSTIIRLSSAYLATLAPGTHTLVAIYTNGSASTTFTIEDDTIITESNETIESSSSSDDVIKAPESGIQAVGDNSNAIGCGIMATIASICAVIIIARIARMHKPCTQE